MCGHTDNGERYPLDVDGLAEGGRVPGELSGPIGVTENGDGRVRRLVLQSKSAATRETHAQTGEKVPADFVGFGFFRLFTDADRHLVDGERNVGHQARKHGVLLAKLFEDRFRE